MVVKRAFAICVMITALVVAAGAQDLTGFWKGNLSMQGCFPENNIELQITMNGSRTSGDSYHYQDIDNYVKKLFVGSYDRVQKRLVVNEGDVTTYHIPYRCRICVKQFNLVYSRNGDVETLSGSWNGSILNSTISCNGGNIVLTRIRESAFKEIPEIKIDTGSIRLDFYDNAQIDGDTISVRVNDRIVLSHQRLTGKPVTTYINVDMNNKFHEVEMIAENQGSIPPNTAILIITAGDQRHQLLLNSTDVKNARVRFVYDPRLSVAGKVVSNE
jgi:hypothetical protein